MAPVMRSLLPMLIATAGCIGGTPQHTPRPETPAPNPPASSDPVTLGAASAMMHDPADGGVAAEQPDMLSAPKSDLTGLTDCFGFAACDPANMLCIKYLNGSTGNPGLPRMAPSCFAPADGCPNGVLNCACIQADQALALNCGTCIDNGNNTYTCYAQ
jgi:hypothetical protein